MNSQLFQQVSSLGHSEFSKDTIKEGFSLVVSMMEEFSKVPSVDPIASTKSFKFESTNDIKAERLNKYRNAILNNKN
jgi:hypothetical protein